MEYATHKGEKTMNIIFVDKKTGKHLRVKRSIKRRVKSVSITLIGAIYFYMFLCTILMMGK
jgi:hypothetical protein